jgi:hypothetical protein
MECKLCGATKFRISRLRVPDLSELVLLRYPVRCRTCYKRVFVNLFTVLLIHRANKRRHEEERRRKMQQTRTTGQA